MDKSLRRKHSRDDMVISSPNDPRTVEGGSFGHMGEDGDFDSYDLARIQAGNDDRFKKIEFQVKKEEKESARKRRKKQQQERLRATSSKTEQKELGRALE